MLLMRVTLRPIISCRLSSVTVVRLVLRYLPDGVILLMGRRFLSSLPYLWSRADRLVCLVWLLRILCVSRLGFGLMWVRLLHLRLRTLLLLSRFKVIRRRRL